MGTRIFHFSGTGNSLAVARGLATRLGGTLLSLPAAMDEGASAGGDAVGLVFPVYHGSVPLIVKRFIGRLEDVAGKYAFAVCTHGGNPGLTIEHLRALLRARGGELAAGFAVHMPYNYITPSFALRGFLSSFTLREVPQEEQQALVAGARQRVEEIASFVAARGSGTFQVSADPITRLVERLDLKESLAKPVWMRVAGVDPRTGMPFLESRQLMDRAFLSDEGCSGCGTCARICPVHDIEMRGGSPTWQGHCEQCFACLQWCPRQAIQFGANTAGRKRYHHPEVTLADMLRRQ